MFRLITNGINILPYSSDLEWNSDIDTLGTQLSFESIKNLQEMQVVSLYKNDKELIRGVVIKKTEKVNSFSYIVQDYSFYLKNKTLKQFNGLSASDCIKALIGDAYLVGNITDIPTIITHIYRDETLDEIIEDILEKARIEQGIYYFRDITGNVLNIYRLEDMKIVPNILIGEYDIDSSVENMKNDIQVISSEEEYNSIIASASDETKFDYYGKLSDTIIVDADNVAQALNMAKNKLNELNKIEKSTTIPLIVLDENVEIKANRYIYLSEGRLIGYYLVKSAKHTLIDGLHKCDIEIKLDVEANTITSTYEDSSLIDKIITDAVENKGSTSSSSKVEDIDTSDLEEIEMHLSFYTGALDEGGPESASGKKLKYGMCASNVYEFGTKFKIVGINGLNDGIFTVEDRGGSDFNSANRLDIFLGNGAAAVEKANRLGRQICTAYKLNKRNKKK